MVPEIPTGSKKKKKCVREKRWDGTSLEHGDYEGTDPAERAGDGAGRGLCLGEEYLSVDGEREGTSTCSTFSSNFDAKKEIIMWFKKPIEKDAT